MAQVWNMFDGLPGVHPRISLDNPLLYTQRSGGWGGARVVNPGLGDTIKIIKSANEIGGAVVGGAASIGAAWATAAIPIVGPAVAAVTIAIMLIMSRKGPKQKTATTKIVEDIEPQLQANVDGYINGPRTLESQQQALENFKAGWLAVLENCGDPAMGTPGQRCITERMEGARPQWDVCKNEPGGCPNWFELYRDPILANPPLTASPLGKNQTVTTNAGPDRGTVTGPGAGDIAGQITSTLSGGGILPWLFMAGVAYVALGD